MLIVSTEIIPLPIAPVRDATPNEMLAGKPMNVVNVAVLHIPVAMLIPLKQVFNHISLFNILAYLLHFFLKDFQAEELIMEDLDMYYSSSFLLNE